MRACGMSHREIRELVAELEPRPDVAPSVRRLPERPAPGNGSPLQLGAPRVASHAVNLEPGVVAPARPAVVEPLAPTRYQVRFTASAEFREKLERLQALMRSSVRDADLARIIDKDPLRRRPGRRRCSFRLHQPSPDDGAGLSLPPIGVGRPQDSDSRPVLSPSDSAGTPSWSRSVR